MAVTLGELRVDEANVESFLRRCAGSLPGDHRPDAQAWGGSAAGALLSQAAGTPLYVAAVKVLERFFASGSEDEIRLAATFAPAQCDPAAIEAALAHPDLGADTARAVRAALGRALGAQPHKYNARHRPLLNQPGGDALLSAALIADHGWVSAHLPAVLSSDPTEALRRLYFAVPDLRMAELASLRDEIESARSVVGDAVTSAAVTYLDGEIARGAAPLGPARWSRP
jgi:hypothetical protein